MKRISQILIAVILTILLSCNKNNPLVEEEFETNSRDTTSRELAKDIFLRFDSINSSYTLDQQVETNIILENKSNKTGLPIYIDGYPPFIYWRVLDQDGEYISGGPTIVACAVYRDTLYSGEKLNEKFYWQHHISDSQEMYSGLKAFSGKYLLRVGFAGIDSKYKPYIIKHFEITETGEPLSTHIYRYYNKDDSVNYDFIVRNRIKKEITLTKSDKPCYIYFLNYTTRDTLYKSSITPDKQNYNLKGHSDNILARFRSSKKQFIEQGIKGSFRAVIKLNFRERVITDESLLFIF